jgi:hypothetical protein
MTQMGNRRWRLSNLYTCATKEGRLIPFRPNWAQEALLDELHECNLILKARQLGFTTFIQLFMLDACLFNSNIRCGTIAHKLEDGREIFWNKVRLPYDHLPDGLKAARPVLRDSADELIFANNSSIRVSTSMRSGTLQYLHISEYGQLCANFPEKAREVRTGALNTIQAGQVVFIEGVVIEENFKRYFDQLEETHDITLNAAQRAWYVKKSDTQLEDMKREYPSTPEEAFEASVEGAYYAQQMAKVELQQRIGSFPAEPNFKVNTAWDIGIGDDTAIWCFQIMPGVVRLVGYYANSGEGMPHYLDKLELMGSEKGWAFGTHYMPHDIQARSWTDGLTRIEQMIREVHKRRLGKHVVKVPNHRVDDGIDSTRRLLGICQFDAAACSEGIKCLKNYRKDWDGERGVWKDRPRHDSASHGADAFVAPHQGPETVQCSDG